MILFLKRTLAALPKRQSLALVPLFEQQRSRRAMICLLLAILEMVKQQAIRLTQKESFGEIFIQRDEGFDQLLAGERDASRIEEEYKS
jgi:segregation and condensation protein A